MGTRGGIEEIRLRRACFAILIGIKLLENNETLDGTLASRKTTKTSV